MTPNDYGVFVESRVGHKLHKVYEDVMARTLDNVADMASELARVSGFSCETVREADGLTIKLGFDTKPRWRKDEPNVSQ